MGKSLHISMTLGTRGKEKKYPTTPTTPTVKKKKNIFIYKYDAKSETGKK